jgi:hypothetical protein
MNANELRIGNYVKFGKLFKKVVEIAEEGFYILDKDGTTLKNTWADLQPILLTEEWLLKFGFEKDEKNEYWFWKNCVSVSVLGYIELLSFNRQSFKTNIQLKYIHQLQNLYFALTGKELVVSNIVNENLQQNTVSSLNCPTCTGDSWMQNLIQSEKKYCKCGAIF